MREVSDGRRPNLCISKHQPGYLDLPSDKLDRLISNEPIEKYYEVEDQPFARGKFAAVRKCTHRTSGEAFAAKFLKKRRRAAELRGEIIHEVAVLEACAGCPRVVRLHQVFESDSEMILLLELAPGGELQNLLDQDEVPEERQVKRLMKQIMDGVSYLHSINVAHLDIKPQNLVLTGEYPQCDVKLCDFGISRYISHGADIREILGTPDYVAPEVLNYEPISLATDMWSVGVLIYVLLTGCSPFGGDTKQETFCNISHCKLDFPEDLFDEISEDAKDLINKLLIKEPSKRLSASECLEHAWFSLKQLEGVAVSAKVATSITKVTTCVSEVVRTPTPIIQTFQPVTKPFQPIAKSSMPTNTIKTSVKMCKTLPRTKSVPSLLTSFSPVLLVPPPSIPNTPPPLPSTPPPSLTSKRNGIKPDRQSAFKKNMASLLQGLDGSDNPSLFNTSAPAVLHTSHRGRSPLFTAMLQGTPVPRRSEEVYKFRRCHQDVEEEHLMNALPHRMFVHSSGPSSTGSDSPYEHSSDNSSDTVSEMSIDSSSDRSSIISLDDSLDLAFSKRLYGDHNWLEGPFNVRLYRQQLLQQAKNSSSSNVRKIWPKECTGSFARAFSLFSEEMHESKETASRKWKPVSSKSMTTHCMLNASSMSKQGGRKCSVELMREDNGNLVVIREVENGKYSRFHEVKCESLQSRIRKLQVQQS